MVDWSMSRDTHFMTLELFSLIQKKVKLYHFVLTGRKK